MSDPLTLLGPSTESVNLELEHFARLSNSLSACRVIFGAKSVMRSARTCDLRAVHGWKVISYLLSFTVHFVSRLDSLGLCRYAL